MSLPKLCLLLGLVAGLVGCAQQFVLTNSSATDRVMRTSYVAKLQEENPTRLVCYGIEVEAPTSRLVSLGEDHPDHVTALATFRVTGDGEVWRETTASNLELLWVPVR